jgi:NitT/TauT family transport system substrate-binding protein
MSCTVLARRLAGALLLLSFAAAAPLVRAEIKVGYSDWPGWVAWAIAEQQGFFKKHGADVKLVWFPTYTDSIAALSAGQLDANSQTWSDTMAPLAKGVPLKVVLVNDNSAGNDAVMASPRINKLSELKGKTIALEEFSVSHFLLVTALSKHGMSTKDVKVVNLGAGDAAAAFIAGRVDAAVVWNPWIHQIQQSGKGKPVFTSKDIPGLIPDLLVAQEKSLKAKRKDFVGMVKAWFDVVRFIEQKPDEAAKIMAKVVGLPPEEYKVFLPGTRFFDEKENAEALAGAAQGKSLLAAAPTILKFLDDSKLIEGKPDYAKAVDATLIQDAVKR